MHEPYISPPIAVDQTTLALATYERIQAVYVEWEPHEGNLEVILINAVANMIAELRETASDVPAQIFAYLGSSILGIPRQDAVEATAMTTWTMKDNAGYTVEQGTLIGIPVSGSEVQPFEVIADFTVAAGDTQATAVEVRAINEGEAPNDATGAPYLLDARYDYVTAVALTSGPSGGQDRETTDAYLNRLRARYEILAPRPILPDDFAVMATDIEQVDRAMAIDLYVPGVNEKESITIDATAGAWTYEPMAAGQVASGLAWNISASALQTALEGLSNIAPGDVVVTGGPGATAPLVVEYRGQYAGQNLTAGVTTDTLSGGAGTATVATVTEGVAPQTAAERAVTVAVIDEDGEALSAGVKTEVDDYLQAQREVNFLVSVIDPTYTVIDVSADIVPVSAALSATAVADAEAAIEAYLDPGAWGRSVPEFANWETIDKVYVNEIVHLLEALDTVARVPLGSVEIGRAGTTATAADLTLLGPAPLPAPGTIAVTAV